MMAVDCIEIDRETKTYIGYRDDVPIVGPWAWTTVLTCSPLPGRLRARGWSLRSVGIYNTQLQLLGSRSRHCNSISGRSRGRAATLGGGETDILRSNGWHRFFFFYACSHGRRKRASRKSNENDTSSGVYTYCPVKVRIRRKVNVPNYRRRRQMRNERCKTNETAGAKNRTDDERRGAAGRRTRRKKYNIHCDNN